MPDPGSWTLGRIMAATFVASFIGALLMFNLTAAFPPQLYAVMVLLSPVGALAAVWWLDKEEYLYPAAVGILCYFLVVYFFRFMFQPS